MNGIAIVLLAGLVYRAVITTWMKILILIASLALLGCQPQTDIREYTIDDYHVVVGVLEKNGKQKLIMSHDGQLWEVPEGVSVSSKPLTLESFQRVTR